jgi:ATP-dependent DNA helicase RecQ
VGSAQGQQEQPRLELAQQQLRRMEAVAEGEGCREQALLLAVGELGAACGRCDNCQSQADRRDWGGEVAEALEALEARPGRDLRSLAEDLAAGAPGGERPRQEARWGWLLRRLVQEELLSESDDGAQRLYLRASGRRYRRQPWPLHWVA